MSIRKCRAKLPAVCRVHGLQAQNPSFYQQIDERVKQDEQAFADFLCSSSEPVVKDIRNYLLAGSGTPSISYCKKHEGYHPYQLDDALALLGTKKAALFQESFLRSPEFTENHKKMGKQLAFARYAVLHEKMSKDKKAISLFRKKAEEGTANLPTIPASEVSDELMMEYWQCGRKRPYVSSAEAQTHTQVATDGEPMNIYECSHCGKYHVGHGKGDNTVEEQLKKARAHWGTTKQTDIFSFRKGII